MPFGGGTPGGSNAGLFLPPGQSGVAAELGSTLSPIANQGNAGVATLGGNTPAGYAWPFVQGTTANALNNPYTPGLLTGATRASDIYTSLFPQVQSVAGALGSVGNQGLNQLGNVFGQSVNNPAYGQAATYGSQGAAGISPLVSRLEGAATSPIFEGAQTVGGGIGNLLAGEVNPALQVANDPQYRLAEGYGRNQAGQLQGAANQILSSAFDPQQALYQRMTQQLTDQINAGLANSGVASSPYGQGVLGNALGNFNIDWQNNLLNRMTQGGQAASGLDAAALSSLTGPALARAQGLGAGTSAAERLGSGALSSYLTPATANLGALSTGLSGYESGVGSQIQDILGPANAQTVAGLQGANTFGNIADTISRVLPGGLGLLSQFASALPGISAAPYNAYQGVQGNQFGALQNEIALGNQNYAVPQQVIGDLQQYLGLGQSASSLANSIGATNFNESAALGQGGINALGGINNLTGGGITNLFAGGGGGAAGIGADFGGGGSALGVPDALGLAGGGGDLAAAAPLAFSA